MFITCNVVISVFYCIPVVIVVVDDDGNDDNNVSPARRKACQRQADCPRTGLC